METKIAFTAFFTSLKYPDLASHASEVLMRGTIAADHMRRVLYLGHPILDILATLLRMAEGYESRYESSIAGDYVLGECWIDTAIGAKRMLDGDFGAIDNGCAEWFFWHVCEIAGFDRDDVEGRI